MEVVDPPAPAPESSPRVLTRKYVSLRFPKVEQPFTFPVSCEIQDKVAVVMFANDKKNISGRTRSYLNTATAPDGREAFQDASRIVASTLAISPDVRKVYGIVTKLHGSVQIAEQHSSCHDRHVVHELH
jgi:hypothetical protein